MHISTFPTSCSGAVVSSVTGTVYIIAIAGCGTSPSEGISSMSIAQRYCIRKGQDGDEVDLIRSFAKFMGRNVKSVCWINLRMDGDFFPTPSRLGMREV